MPRRVRPARLDALAAALRKVARAVDDARYLPGIPSVARERLLAHLEGAAHHASKALASGAGRTWQPTDASLIAARGEFGFYELMERYGED